MIEEIIKDIYKINVGMPNNPLKAINCYFIRGEESDLLIDTCFRRDECRRDLDAGLAELKSERSRRDLLITHLHSDHAGLANEYVGDDRSIYMSGVDLGMMQGLQFGDKEPVRSGRMLEEGFPKAALEEAYSTNPANTMAISRIDERFKPLNDGDEIKAGRYTLKTVVVPGHTPGNAMFWIESEKAMFTGDHLLFDVTPNIMAWPGVEDSLGDYLDNLEKSKKYPVKLALPGHRKPGDYHARIDELLLHHTLRIEEALNIVKENPDMCAYDIAGLMSWKIRADNWETFPVIQKWFAVGECLSHLDYLLKRGQVSREKTQGLWRYRAV